MKALQRLKQLDKSIVLHPYTSMLSQQENYLVNRCDKQYLYLDDNKQVIDGMSSWWCALHGYNNLQLNNAITKQMKNMAHVMFGGLTHEPAINLSNLLLTEIVNINTNKSVIGENLTKVFLCDSGSVSVEVAIKMCYQYSQAKYGTENKKTKLLTIKNGYHGDTFGAMSVCDPVNGMHYLFNDIIHKNHFIDSPSCKFNVDNHSSNNNKNKCSCDDQISCDSIKQMRKALENNGDEIAGMILEPIVQGAGGMKFYSPNFLRQVRKICNEFDILLIADEIATGFGRTGELLACHHANIMPDILCLGKSLTGGYVTMGATITNDKVAETISKNDGIFAHGPTFMGNPLACAVAIESTLMLLNQDWKLKVIETESALKKSMFPLQSNELVQDIRVMGAIGVCELKQGLTKQEMLFVQKEMIKKGVWIRPFGKLIYTMPPFLCKDMPISDVEKIGQSISEVINLLLLERNERSSSS